ncbi:DUF1275 family protein [Nocardia sp. NPDC050406]|uniref:DUF1275 family protein n=1 Tax=Nocardia sp. NPDC050406 TaxID=3364318 RepID=UPI0037AC6013
MPITPASTVRFPGGPVPLVLLAAGAGGMDALVFTALGKVFASVLTGNLVLLGVAVVTAGIEVSAPVTVIAGYLVGVVGAARWCRGARVRRIPECLAAATVLAGVLAVLVGLGAGGVLLPLLVASLAMGIQSATVMVADNASPTTYLTSTVTRFFSDLAANGSVDSWAVARIAGLVTGAGAAVALGKALPEWGFALPAVFIAMAAVLVIRAGRAALSE